MHYYRLQTKVSSLLSKGSFNPSLTCGIGMEFYYVADSFHRIKSTSFYPVIFPLAFYEQCKGHHSPNQSSSQKPFNEFSFKFSIAS
jgi:hypothetical protein